MSGIHEMSLESRESTAFPVQPVGQRGVGSLAEFWRILSREVRQTWEATCEMRAASEQTTEEQRTEVSFTSVNGQRVPLLSNAKMQSDMNAFFRQFE